MDFLNGHRSHPCEPRIPAESSDSFIGIEVFTFHWVRSPVNSRFCELLKLELFAPLRRKVSTAPSKLSISSSRILSAPLGFISAARFKIRFKDELLGCLLLSFSQPETVLREVPKASATSDLEPRFRTSIFRNFIRPLLLMNSEIPSNFVCIRAPANPLDEECF